ncbi:MAG: tRNA (adenosine(37)-N6)-threonylcarbamoyltransferase complex ATPase subunit type 1 TsaE [Ruminococcus sp.]|nr:tRNA (adenosine(37)-N6)-threonylcarbamoyltransferase complex ATPase subunit type 1 TsaE [Ruminococcus sp.]
MTFTFTTHDPAQTIALGEQIGKRLKGGEVIAYSGGLGVGKTTITRGISMGMGLGDEVTSPTFALVNEYAGEQRSLCHFDMYRISGGLDLETTGFYDYLDGNNVLAVEWSENIADELPDDCIKLHIERIDDTTREITLTADERFADITLG